MQHLSLAKGSLCTVNSVGPARDVNKSRLTVVARPSPAGDAFSVVPVCPSVRAVPPVSQNRKLSRRNFEFSGNIALNKSNYGRKFEF